jgi:hypothetical protein
MSPISGNSRAARAIAQNPFDGAFSRIAVSWREDPVENRSVCLNCGRPLPSLPVHGPDGGRGHICRCGYRIP